MSNLFLEDSVLEHYADSLNFQGKENQSGVTLAASLH